MKVYKKRYKNRNGDIKCKKINAIESDEKNWDEKKNEIYGEMK